MPINLSARHLRAFIAVADAQSFTKAAEVLHVTQPSLSATIRQFEDFLGARLFERHTKMVRLTGVGESYLGVAQRLLSEMESSVDVVRDLVEKRKGHLHIASLPSVAAGFLAKELSQYRNRFPNIGISLKDGLNQPTLELVRRGDVDLGFVHLDHPLDDLQSELLYQEHYSLICKPDHPLAGEGPITWSEITDFPFIQVAQGSSTHEVTAQAFADIGHVLRNKIETNMVSTAIGMVAEGFGVTALPAKGFRYLVGPHELVVRPLTSPTAYQRIHMAVREKRWLSPAAEAFYDQIIAARGKESPTTLEAGG